VAHTQVKLQGSRCPWHRSWLIHKVTTGITGLKVIQLILYTYKREEWRAEKEDSADVE